MNEALTHSLRHPLIASVRLSLSLILILQYSQAWHIIHAIAGYGALILALATVGLGITEYNLAPEW